MGQRWSPARGWGLGGLLNFNVTSFSSKNWENLSLEFDALRSQHCSSHILGQDDLTSHLSACRRERERELTLQLCQTSPHDASSWGRHRGVFGFRLVSLHLYVVGFAMEGFFSLEDVTFFFKLWGLSMTTFGMPVLYPIYSFHWSIMCGGLRINRVLTPHVKFSTWKPPLKGPIPPNMTC